MAGAEAETRTPWGTAEELQARKLNPGMGVSAAEVARSQRERLFGAVVLAGVERGYEATTVADLLALSGVSRASFYRHFNDKSECFAAAIAEIFRIATTAVSHGLQGEGSWPERGREGFDLMLEMIVAEPAAARCSLVEAWRARGQSAEQLDQARAVSAGLTEAVFQHLDDHAGTPPELVAAIIGGVHAVIYRRLALGQTAELAELGDGLWEWALSYPPPPAPLVGRGRTRRRGPAQMPPFAAHVPAERMLRGFSAAVAAKGFERATIADIATAASMSQATFYEHFANKEEALAAALDSSGAQLLAATLPAVRRAPDWPSAMRAAMETICGFLAAEPDFARLRAVEVYAIGPEAVAARDRAGREILQVVLALAFEEPPQMDSLAVEAMAGAVNSLFYDRVRREGPASLPEAAPLAIYIALAPLVGPETAYAVAAGDRHGIDRAVAESTAPHGRLRATSSAS